MNKKVVAVVLIIALIAGVVVLYMVKPEFLKNDVGGRKIRVEKLGAGYGVKDGIKKGKLKKGVNESLGKLKMDKSGKLKKESGMKGITLYDEKKEAGGLKKTGKLKKGFTGDKDGTEPGAESVGTFVPTI